MLSIGYELIPSLVMRAQIIRSVFSANASASIADICNIADQIMTQYMRA